MPAWLRAYDRRWLRPDLVAGLTLAAYLLPAGIGDASLAGLAPEAGLYACLFSWLVFLIALVSVRACVGARASRGRPPCCRPASGMPHWQGSRPRPVFMRACFLGSSSG